MGQGQGHASGFVLNTSWRISCDDLVLNRGGLWGVGGRCGEPTSSLALRRGFHPPCIRKRTGNSTAGARGHKRAYTSTSYPKDTASCVSARTVHVCTVAFGSGREGGTCWKDQRFLPAHPALQKAGSFCFLGEGAESPPPLWC